MKLLKYSVAAAALLSVSAVSAAPINVGGVVWDPDAPSAGADKDFTARFEFNQWFTTGADAVANADGASPTVDPAKILNPNTVGIGDTLQGVGEVFRLNGDSSGFCPSCELTFVFGGFEVTGATTLSDGWFRLYVDSSPDFDVAGVPLQSAEAADGNLWLELEVDTNQFTSAGGFGSGFLTTFNSAIGGLAQANFDTNFFVTSDLRSSASALFEFIDTTGDGQDDSWIATSTGEIKGDSIPVPAPLALIGVGLALVGFSSRKRSAEV